MNLVKNKISNYNSMGLSMPETPYLSIRVDTGVEIRLKRTDYYAVRDHMRKDVLNRIWYDVWFGIKKSISKEVL